MFPLSLDDVSLCFVLSPYFLAAQEAPGPSCVFAVAAKSQPSAPMCGSFYCRMAVKTKILASVGYQRMHSEQCIQDAQAKMLKCSPNSNKQVCFYMHRTLMWYCNMYSQIFNTPLLKRWSSITTTLRVWAGLSTFLLLIRARKGKNCNFTLKDPGRHFLNYTVKVIIITPTWCVR